MPQVSTAYQGEIVAAPNVAIVQTRAGKLQGYLHKGIYNDKGVQYAQAERFMPPREVDSWNGIKTAMTYGKVAPQLTDEQNDIFPPNWYLPHWRPINYPQSDDCQNLNIWTLNITSRNGLVARRRIFYENLSRKGYVVVISVSHRLNSLGFPDLSAYGEKYRNFANNGMLDIIAALE